MIFPSTHRSREILQTIGRVYPSAWQQAEGFRAARGRELPDWPEWCYLPMHAAYAIVSRGGDNRVPIDRASHIAIIGALAAWRMGQQIIRYDETLYRSLIETPISGDIPADLLYHLPAWCLYIETPGLTWTDRTLHGFFVHLDWDNRVAGHPHNELRFLLDTSEAAATALDAHRGLLPMPLILGHGTIEEAVEKVIASGKKEAAKDGLQIPSAVSDMTKTISETLTPLISLTLYLCSESPDWDLEPPKNPPAVKTKQGLRTFPVPQPRLWDVGVRIGAALRSASAIQAETTIGTHASPRAHIRRAHWHTYLAGSGRSKRRLKWLPPIPINVETLESLPSTIQIIKRKE